ncbi:30S ribosomal protein S14 [Bifidobacterium breve]|nr:30S ribosomal protein S14 [Bifidobacterium breve]MDG5963123.1 30S ribosomal protein S14 [Bifidobacterium breve]MDG5968707.1 30S ribosomal protein S14 [Bifidobacterium breve]
MHLYRRVARAHPRCRRKSRAPTTATRDPAVFGRRRTRRGDAQAAGPPPRRQPTRLRNRDSIDGRPRTYNRKFGLSRINLREKAHKGELPGVVKSSW